MRPLFLVLALALPLTARAEDSLQKINQRAAAEIEAIRQQDAAEKRELRALIDGDALRDEARAAKLFDQIFANGSRVAAVELRRAQELRRLLTPAQLARMIVEQR